MKEKIWQAILTGSPQGWRQSMKRSTEGVTMKNAKSLMLAALIVFSTGIDDAMARQSDGFRMATLTLWGTNAVGAEQVEPICANQRRFVSPDENNLREIPSMRTDYYEDIVSTTRRNTKLQTLPSITTGRMAAPSIGLG
jgi:hypothetical protein